MTPLEPGYGETPLDWDELAALLPDARDALPDPPTKADVYDLEQAVQTAVTEDLVSTVLDGTVSVADVITDRFLRDLHARLYGDIWTWGGRLRRYELNLGVAPEQIAMDLRGSLDGILYRWQRTSDWSAHQLGIAVHAETVRIHPFADGNGRSTRLLADLTLLAAQRADEPPATYDWDVDKERYIEALRRYDQHRDPTELATIVLSRPIGG
ncbi:Fic family protein [Cellulomonas sp. zg-ZUI222]|uniref:Fic family protein n=1 Tax=Cellulomonas TaxID=1707 RepID=UPI001A94101C|nr:MULTISPECIES: Fic family protein [Cellulomonas]MBO0899490.1 Fic family protein [Cellulomonas sp. zg-ZUI22]MBO0920341.1 Fic family protein [Cellulomonas wangleii]